MNLAPRNPADFWLVAGKHEWEPGALLVAGMSFVDGTSSTSAKTIQAVYASIARSYSAEERAK